jgi:hypothetical protein
MGNQDKNFRAKKHIILLGASIGGAWDISRLHERAGSENYSFEYVHGGSQFDKSAPPTFPEISSSTKI